jgi:primary-amine oxidase
MVHPLRGLSVQETERAKETLLAEHKGELIIVREIWLQEPPKQQLRKFLDLEHSGNLTATCPRPARCAAAQYDVVGSDKIPYFHEAVVDIDKKAVVKHEVISKEQHAPLKL